MSKSFQSTTSSRAARKLSPQPEGNLMPPEQRNSEPLMENLLAEVSRISTTLTALTTDVTTIKESTTELRNSINAIQERLTEAEGRISDVEDTTEQIVDANEHNERRVEMLWNRVEDLENRSRRNNVRLIGLKEGAEAGGLMKCIQSIMSDGFGLELDEEMEIERAHRAPTTRPSEDRPPRLVLIRFLRSSARQKVLQAAKAKRGVMWSGCKVPFFPDMSRELAEKRRAFTEARSMLQKINVRHTLAFPAVLRFTWKEKKKSFSDSTEAEKFIMERGDKAGKLLARQLKQQTNNNVIPVVKKGDVLVSSSEERNGVFKQCYENIYTSQVNQEQN
uniref:L1 transposable element RRM domain-containing protein n=1 Tax=Labrus bergylta TaxID=56723 RepID=A0A3Q3MPB5_9LABR